MKAVGTSRNFSAAVYQRSHPRLTGHCLFRLLWRRPDPSPLAQVCPGSGDQHCAVKSTYRSPGSRLAGRWQASAEAGITGSVCPGNSDCPGETSLGAIGNRPRLYQVEFASGSGF